MFPLAERRILLGRKYVHGLSNNNVKVEEKEKQGGEVGEEGLKETKEKKKTTLWFTMKIINGGSSAFVLFSKARNRTA